MTCRWTVWFICAHVCSIEFYHTVDCTHTQTQMLRTDWIKLSMITHLVIQLHFMNHWNVRLYVRLSNALQYHQFHFYTQSALRINELILLSTFWCSLSMPSSIVWCCKCLSLEKIVNKTIFYFYWLLLLSFPTNLKLKFR